jgi:hypothetical protein
MGDGVATTATTTNLLPRVSLCQGFVYMVQRLRGHVDAVYDMTIAYPDGLPQSELDLLKGCFPKEIHVHTKVPRFATKKYGSYESSK